MGNGLRLYLRYLGLSIRAQMQYRTAFAMAALGQFGATAIELVGIWALFDRFGGVEGWTLAQVAVFYGVVHTAFALGDSLSTGFDRFSELVKHGTFDRLLLRPRSTVLQLAGQELALKRIGRLASGVLVLSWGGHATGVEWGPFQLGLLVFALCGGTCLFFGLIVVQATIAFFTTETLELMNILTFGGVETAQYPLSIYQKWFRRFFTFVVPLACVSYFPIVAILGVDDPLGTTVGFQARAPSLGLVFLLAALQLWKLGVRHYTSTGS